MFIEIIQILYHEYRVVAAGKRPELNKRLKR
jgi:hypothetical protein